MGILQRSCEHHISETMPSKKYSLALFGERKHSEKLLIIMLILQSEEVSHFNSFVRQEFVIKSTLK